MFENPSKTETDMCHSGGMGKIHVQLDFPNKMPQAKIDAKVIGRLL
jgi:hypothetical protein